MVGITLSELDAIIAEYREKKTMAKNRSIERDVAEKMKEYERTM